MLVKLLLHMALISLPTRLVSRGVLVASLQTSFQYQRGRLCSTSLQTAVAGKAPDLVLPGNIEKWLDIDMAAGRCVGISSGVPMTELIAENNNLLRAYHPDEIDYSKGLSGATAESFLLGRLAMRLALDYPKYPILKDSHGRPALQGNFLGSISHKGNCGVAMVALATSKLVGVGVDVEHTERPGKRSIAPRVLTPMELESLGKLPGVKKDEEVLLRFSLKEAIYKAVHPVLCQYVGFQEAEVTPYSDGTATCKWLLESGNDSLLGMTLHAYWKRLDDENFFLTSASVERS